MDGLRPLRRRSLLTWGALALCESLVHADPVHFSALVLVGEWPGVHNGSDTFRYAGAQALLEREAGDTVRVGAGVRVLQFWSPDAEFGGTGGQFAGGFVSLGAYPHDDEGDQIQYFVAGRLGAEAARITPLNDANTPTRYTPGFFGGGVLGAEFGGARATVRVRVEATFMWAIVSQSAFDLGLGAGVAF